MEYKILEQNGVENENIDGAAFNNFCADGRDLVIKGVLNECNFVNYETNSIKIDTGELLIQGFRIKIVEPYIYSFSSYPVIETRYEIVAKLTLRKDRSVTFEFIVRTPQTLTQNDLYKTEEGIYEVVFSAFSHHPALGATALERLFKVEKGDDTVRVINTYPTEDTVGTVGEIVALVQEAGAERPNEYVATLFTLTTIKNGNFIWKAIPNIDAFEDLDNRKQDTLVSGENIKTINGKSILGEGDIAINGGGTNVEANPTEEATEDLSKLKVGDKVYDVVDKTKLDKKVDEWDGVNGGNYTLRARIKGGEGSITTYLPVSTTPKQYSVPYFLNKDSGTSIPAGANGYIVCLDPINPYHTSNKKYVDDAIANAGGGGAKIYLHEFTYRRIDREFDVEFTGYGCFYSLSKELCVFENMGGLYIDEDNNSRTVISIPVVEDEGFFYPFNFSFGGGTQQCYNFSFTHPDFEMVELSETVKEA